MPVAIRHKPIRADQAGLQAPRRHARDEAERPRPSRRRGVHRRAVDPHGRVLPGEAAVRVKIQNPVTATREVRRFVLPQHSTKRARRVGVLARNDEHRSNIVEQLKRQAVVQPVEPQHRQPAQRISRPLRLPGDVGLRGGDAGGRLPTRHAALRVGSERVGVCRVEPKPKARNVGRPLDGWIWLVEVAPILPRCEHQQMRSRRNRGFREAPLERLRRVVGQPKASQVHRRGGGIVQLDPVRKIAVLVGQCRPVVRHHFADNDPGIFGQAAAVRLRPVHDALKPATVRTGQANFPLRRRETETQRAAVERQSRLRADEAQRREDKHRRRADRLAGESHPVESHGQRARVGQLDCVALTVRWIGYPLGNAHGVRLAKRERDVRPAERWPGERPVAGAAGTPDGVPLQLRPELDRVEPLTAAVKKPNAFAIGVQLETEFTAQHEVRPGHEVRSRRKHKLAGLGRIIGEAHAVQVGNGRTVVEQLDLIRRTVGWPGEHLVDDQARVVWSNRP